MSYIPQETVYARSVAGIRDCGLGAARNHQARRIPPSNAVDFVSCRALDEAAKQHHSSPAKISLAWLIARPSVTAPIASATSLGQLNDLIEATRLQLDHSTVESLDRASAHSAAAR
jgi:aryl-alcohol dehydrogenase-like predicted oxidoreductase